MQKTIIQGKFSDKLPSLSVSTWIAAQVALRRLLGRPLVAEWPFLFEHGTLFWRAQFNHAFRLSTDMAASRAYFDSVYALLETYPDVDVLPSEPGKPLGHWFVPRKCSSSMTVLHFHGGGYTFYAGVSRHFATGLAQTLGAVVFAPDYRLTPEHPHPAQLDDGLAAYRYLLERGIPPERLVLCGDSAGGHLALMTLAHIRRAGLPKPALTICISPWTDIGRRGASLFGNDPYDLVQGYMAQQFAAWLKGEGNWQDAELSPIGQDYRDLGPIYLQAGGREILVDMIRDFAQTIAAQGVKVQLDVWRQMNHEFHAYGNILPESRAAMALLREAVRWAEGKSSRFAPNAHTECDAFGSTSPLGSTLHEH